MELKRKKKNRTQKLQKASGRIKKKERKEERKWKHKTKTRKIGKWIEIKKKVEE